MPGIKQTSLVKIDRGISAAADNDGPGLEIGGYHTEVSADMAGMLPKDLVGNALDGSAVAEIFRDLFKNTVYDDGGNDLAWLSVAFPVAIDNRLTAGRPFDGFPRSSASIKAQKKKTAGRLWSSR